MSKYLSVPLIVLLLSNLNLYSQDSLQRKYGQLLRQKFDSAQRDPVLVQLKSEIDARLGTSKNLNTFNLFYELDKADLGTFNTDLSNIGFDQVRQYFHGFGFGLSKIHNRVTTDFSMWFLFRQKSSQNNVTHKLGGSGASFDKGYDFVNTANVKLYPFLGLGFSSVTIRAVKDSVLNIPAGLISIKMEGEQG